MYEKRGGKALECEIRVTMMDDAHEVMQRKLDPVGKKIEHVLRSKGLSEPEVQRRKELLALTY